ncbi:winged helix-turn-helix domain-containing protein, partial [Microgenomates group bacterium]|nr:winged helix-turn-helix domain-containing protein [Microgenomates group bacterium]
MKGPRYVLYFPAVIESLKELGGSGNPNEICDRVAQKLSISDEERGILNKNGGSRFDNYVNWARF